MVAINYLLGCNRSCCFAPVYSRGYLVRLSFPCRLMLLGLGTRPVDGDIVSNFTHPVNIFFLSFEILALAFSHFVDRYCNKLYSPLSTLSFYLFELLAVWAFSHFGYCIKFYSPLSIPFLLLSRYSLRFPSFLGTYYSNVLLILSTTFRLCLATCFGEAVNSL